MILNKLYQQLVSGVVASLNQVVSVGEIINSSMLCAHNISGLASFDVAIDLIDYVNVYVVYMIYDVA